jgi:aminoglycoside phosphotransferase (APT) family kinase protein
VSAEPFRADPSFPQLGVVQDPELMTEVFQRHLRPLDGKTYEVQECQISYQHHREARRCMLHYDLHLAEPGTGRERSQLVTGVMYSGNITRQTWENLRRSQSRGRTAGASPTFAPFSYISDLDMLVQVFPYDHRLPGLPLLMEGPPAELKALLLARFGPGDWRDEGWRVTPLRYRVGQRAALRLTARAREAATGRVAKRRFYAKVYPTKKLGEQAYEVLRELWEKSSAGSVSFTVGKPVAYLDDFRALVQEEVTGTTLRDMLLRGDEAIPAVCKAARALASLHLEDVVTPQRYTLRDEAARLAIASASIRSVCSHLEPKVEEIVSTVVAGLEEVPPAPIHGDLKLNHILLDGESIALIDFDKFAGADPVVDVAHLLYSLATFNELEKNIHVSHDRSQVVASAFLEEYFDHVPGAWRARLPLHYGGLLVKKAAARLRKHLPDGPRKAEVLLEEARSSLADRID